MISTEIKPLPWKYYIPLYLIFISLLLFATRDFSQTQQSSIGLANIHKIMSISLAVTIVLYYFSNKLKIKRIPCAITFYSLYLVVAIIGSLMSSTWLGYSLYKLLEVVAVVLVVIYLWDLSNKYPFALSGAYNKVLLFYKLLLFLSILGVFIFPQLAIRPPSEFQEAYLPFQLFGSIVSINANSLGMIGAIVFYVSFISLFQKIKIKTSLFWLSISMIVVIFSQSRTAVIALLLVIFLFILFNGRSGIFGKLFLLVLGLGTIFFSIDVLVQYLERGYSIEHMEKLSGRSSWWEYAWNVFINSDTWYQYFGGGYGIASRNILVSMGHSGASTLHSDYVDSLVSTGYLGLGFLIVMLLCVVYILVKNLIIVKKDLFILELSGIFVLLSIRSFTGPTIATHNFFLIMYLIVIVNIVLAIKQNKYKRVLQ